MDIRKVMLERKSVRDFKDKTVPLEILKEIVDSCKLKEELVCSTNIKPLILDDGERTSKLLNGIAGYNGLMIEAPQYILFLSNDVENHQIQTGYYVEKIMLALESKSIDTCWLNIPEDGSLVKQVLGIQDSREAAALIAVGYKKRDKKVINPLHTGDNYSQADLKVVDDNTSTRLAPEEIVYLNKWGHHPTSEELKSLGLDNVFFYIRLAPSTLNRQPWRFLIKDKKIYLAIKTEEGINHEHDMLDAGIAMLYTDLIMNDYNYHGKWTIANESSKNYGIPEDYYVAGYFGN